MLNVGVMRSLCYWCSSSLSLCTVSDLSLSFSYRYSLEKDWVFCSLIKPLITWIKLSATSWKLPYYPQRRAALHQGHKHNHPESAYIH